MITKFDASQPIAESRVQSEPIRINFLALNERSDQLTPAATDPVSTSVTVGNGLNIYFEDNSYTPFTSVSLDLGGSSGVSNFNNPSSFKEVIVYFARDSFGVGHLGFLESVELSIRDHSTSTASALINDISAQRVPNETTGVSEEVPDAYNDISPLDDAIVICSIIVTNDGQTGQRGAINPVFDADIIDCRPFLQRTFSTKTIDAAVEAATAGVKITNSQVNLDNQVTTVAGSHTAIDSTSVLVNNANFFDPTTLLFNPVVRISTSSLASAAAATGFDTFETATVVSVDTSGTPHELTLSRKVTVTAGDIVIRGQFTEDRLAYNPLEAPVTIHNASGGALLELETSSNDGYIGIRAPSSLSGIANTDWVLPADEPVVGEVISVESLIGGVATLRWSSPSITTLQLAYNNSPDGYTTTSGGKDVVFDGAESVIIDTLGGLLVTSAITADLIGNVTGNADTATSASSIGSISDTAIVDAYDGYHAATSLNTPLTLVERDASGNFAAGTITASLSGTATNTLNVGIYSSTMINDAYDGYHAATDAYSTGTLVARDSFGNFSAGLITANLAGNATNVSGVVAIENGGTGQITRPLALNALLPTQGTDEILISNGTNALFGKIEDAYVSSTAAIARTKLAPTAAGGFNKAATFGATGFLEPSTITTTELGHLSGVTAGIQGQLNDKADNDLSNLISPTRINQNALPATHDAYDIGSDALEWTDLFVHNIKHGDAGTPDLEISTTSNDGNINLTPHDAGEVVHTGKSFLNGGVRGKITTTGATTLTSADFIVMASGAITLPLSSTVADGQFYIIKNTSGGPITISVTGGDSLDPVGISIPAGRAKQYVLDGTTWREISVTV